MSKWEKYTGSDEQIEEIKAAGNGVMFKYVAGIGTDHFIFKYKDDRYHIDNRVANKAISEYLICDPHPYANEIKIWADTGCPVYYQAIECKDFKGECLSDEFNLYPFARPDRFEYRLTPFEN